MDTKGVTAHVPLPLADRIDELAVRLERSRGWIVKQALATWVEREDEKRRLTLEALEDVDAGRFVDHRAIQAWADSLDRDEAASTPL
jgi:predicted transcriptional regulator